MKMTELPPLKVYCFPLKQKQISQSWTQVKKTTKDTASSWAHQFILSANGIDLDQSAPSY